MKKILNILEDYLRKYPTPSQITHFPDLFKLTYTYSSPFTDSKHTKQVIYPLQPLLINTPLSAQITKIVYNQKGRIQQSDSFESILVKQKHQKLLQDDVFGKAKCNKSQTKWVYIAQVKPEPLKSYFNQGKGKKVYSHDLGQFYDEVKEVGIFIWDKNLKKVFRIEIDKNLIPSFPSFANGEGTQVIFHAYKKQHFGHGVLLCFNRQVGIYKASVVIAAKQAQKVEQGQKPKKPELKAQATVTDLIKDQCQTNIFPSISPCYNYLVYLSGTGITHTYYMDLVVAKNVEGKWTETHRIKQKFVGYYNTLKTYITQQNDKSYAICQTIEESTSQIIKVDLETGVLINLTEKYPNHNFSINDVTQSGVITGVVSTNNFNTFFYCRNYTITIIEPPSKESFVQKEYRDPIHSIYIQAREEDILEQFRDRAKKRPLLVLPHGGPHGSFAQCLTSMRYALLKMGYGLLHPNFSGSIGYGKARLEGALTKIGQVDAQEILQSMRIVIEDNPCIDKDNVHVQGGSYGGYMSAIMGSRYPQHFKSAIILNGVLSLVGNLYFSDIPEWTLVEALARQDISGLTQKDYDQMWRQSPISQPMKIPTLQFLGAKDRRVPYKQGLLFDAMTKQAGTPITTYVYENSAHALADSVETSIDIVVKTLMFLEGVTQQEQNKQ